MSSKVSAGTDTSVDRCASEVRSMILSGILLPGEKVHQTELAEQLKVSRVPVHSALSALQSEGLLVHKPGRGFTVARFDSNELSQIYLMRRVLETELLRSIDLSMVDVGELERLNRELDVLATKNDPEGFQELNLRFHFALFEYAPLPLVRSEVARLWYRSSYYRALSLHMPNAAPSVHDDHIHIIDAVRANDVDELIRASDAHRGITTRPFDHE